MPANGFVAAADDSLSTRFLSFSWELWRFVTQDHSRLCTLGSLQGVLQRQQHEDDCAELDQTWGFDETLCTSVREKNWICSIVFTALIWKKIWSTFFVIYWRLGFFFISRGAQLDKRKENIYSGYQPIPVSHYFSKSSRTMYQVNALCCQAQETLAWKCLLLGFTISHFCANESAANLFT